MLLENTKPAFLVVAATWYPGWQGWLDGKPVAVQRVNGAILGVTIPAGTRELVLEYHTSGLSSGTGLAIAGLMLLGLTCWLPTRTS